MSTNPINSGTSASSFGDKLTIETPEQTALEFAVAGIGSRFLALALDTLIQTGVGLVVGIGGGIAIGALGAYSPKAALWGFAVLGLFFFVLYFGYFAIFEIVWNGQTPGKRKAGIRVIKDSGRPLTATESIGRNLMRIVDLLPALYAVGMVSAVLTKENKRLGDLVAGSLVVREASFSDLKPAWQAVSATSQAGGPGVPPLGAERLTPEDAALIESFLNRRPTLEWDVRVRIAAEIVRRVKPKLTLPGEFSASSEQLLEMLARERRATGQYR